ncbi:6-phosphogluconate dehydrogenase C-terminal domain-like protein [Aspergillus heteromorphus CBS 117.55]|uniref:6-phosphogluconate dehydrogenase C-terminal domain-like protein n=1 Tax=Aspergillus heteromorphus CBS 117.55 TaxID=1448321 RepID=A0A317W219_9EURO|nr:6-phosphogluconate dehydrogenase C-terminal domain-like protein [Aspergillus heteromorphus CBS 117.55]PWY79312.1 6-phosphogluconate dehydrogenase C-terminal domain-like protein [Aspergillus heteromorphus CBS 117.55]
MALRFLANRFVRSIDLPQNATLLLCSTVSASYAQSVAEELVARGRPDIHFVDAPVSGGAKRAADGTLSIMAGGADASLQIARDLLQAMSAPSKLYLVPGGVGAGSNMKMVHQVLAAIHILGASEAMGLAAQLGLDARITADRIKDSEAWTWMHENRFPRMLEEEWNPGASALTIILKDAGIITTSARQSHFPTPLCATAEQIYLSALLQGYGPKDDSAMVRQYYPTPIKDVTPASLANEDPEAATQLVLDLMQGVNLVAAAEAIAFARSLGVDMAQFFELVSDAAGGSKIFVTRGLEMIEGRIGAETLSGTQTVDEVVSRLERVVQKARDLHCPVHLGNAALGVLLMAKGKGHGGEGSASVIQVYP